MKRVLLAAAVFGLCSAASGADDGVAPAPVAPVARAVPAASAAGSGDGQRPRLLRIEPPRDTARHIGDRLRYRALLVWPEGWVLEPEGLPAAESEHAFELRSHRIEASSACADCRWLSLDWQLFKGPRASEDLLLPATPLPLRRGSERVTLELPAAVLAVSPLVPWDSRRNWLDSVRPGWRVLPFDSGARFAEAGAALAVALAALLAWAWGSGRLVLARERRPFAQAWRTLRQRPRAAPADAEDLKLWHRAFDASAGEAVFLENLDRFFAARPALAPLAAAARAVFEASRRRFFLDEDGAAGPTRAELAALLQQLAQAEFGAARRTSGAGHA
ncbi:hypothetical protein [Rubrivivax gelatinosus]|uniref:MxaA protein n=1 Tax=Rubrivivax gelatinosus TaxID=28068 RepID=A0ABS1DZU8_RUBGE|nr:hypothetical protein [Rubrivivax gelatinosus]MBK1714889.1 hypothetical protein [Rubrivivax gelatinosus]